MIRWKKCAVKGSIRWKKCAFYGIFAKKNVTLQPKE